MGKEEEEEEEAALDDGMRCPEACTDEDLVTISRRGLFWQVLLAACVAIPLITAGSFYALLRPSRAPVSVPGLASPSVTWKDVGAIWMVCCITSKLLRMVTGNY